MSDKKYEVEMVLKFNKSVDSYEEAEDFYADIAKNQNLSFSVLEKRIKKDKLMVPYKGGENL